MKKLNSANVALVVGSTAAALHVVWALVVALGWAQGLLDFIFSLNFMSNPFIMQPFDLGKAILLIVVTFVVGYAVGWVFGWIWNTLAKK